MSKLRVQSFAVSPQARMSRRLGFLILALAAAACAPLQTQVPPRAVPHAAAMPAGCDGTLDASRPQYIVGYGSLMQHESRSRTSPQAGPAHPVEVAGFRRGWFVRGSSVGFSTTFLGVVQDRASRLNAVVYKVDADEVAATDRRERSYCRALVPIAQITVLGPDFPLAADAQAWIYVSRGPNVSLPNAKYPIVQSYVDIFITGCLEQEQRYGIAGFARECVATTNGWSGHWVNDRIYPRRPFVHQPHAGEIDRLLAKELPRVFSQIRVE
jgi:hypothetical protein